MNWFGDRFARENHHYLWNTQSTLDALMGSLSAMFHGKPWSMTITAEGYRFTGPDLGREARARLNKSLLGTNGPSPVEERQPRLTADQLDMVEDVVRAILAERDAPKSAPAALDPGADKFGIVTDGFKIAEGPALTEAQVKAVRAIVGDELDAQFQEAAAVRAKVEAALKVVANKTPDGDPPEAAAPAEPDPVSPGSGGGAADPALGKKDSAAYGAQSTACGRQPTGDGARVFLYDAESRVFSFTAEARDAQTATAELDAPGVKIVHPKRPQFLAAGSAVFCVAELEGSRLKFQTWAVDGSDALTLLEVGSHDADGASRLAEWAANTCRRAWPTTDLQLVRPLFVLLDQGIEPAAAVGARAIAGDCLEVGKVVQGGGMPTLFSPPKMQDLRISGEVVARGPVRTIHRHRAAERWALRLAGREMRRVTVGSEHLAHLASDLAIMAEVGVDLARMRRGQAPHG